MTTYDLIRRDLKDRFSDIKMPPGMTRKGVAETCLSVFLTKDGRERLYGEGYLECPASSKYHASYAGGLFDHSFYMKRVLQILCDHLGVSFGRKDSIDIICFLHDLGKLGSYKLVDIGDAYVYEYQTSKWAAKYPSAHHSELSIDIIDDLKLIDLTPEEYNCILYHMGAYESFNIGALGNVAKSYPNLYLVQLADLISSQLLDK